MWKRQATARSRFQFHLPKSRELIVLQAATAEQIAAASTQQVPGGKPTKEYDRKVFQEQKKKREREMERVTHWLPH